MDVRATRRVFLAEAAVAGSLTPGALAAKWRKSLPGAGPENLRVEWLSSPVGIDTRRPRFTWTMAPQSRASRDVSQSACQVVVASSRGNARRGVGDIWDSRRHITKEMRLSPADDLGFASQSRYWWAARIWDATGRLSAWSAPQPFITGIISREDWRARWIAATPDRPLLPLPPSALDAGKPVAPEPLPVFRRDVALSRAIRFAVVCVSGLGQYELTVNGRPATPTILNPGWTNYRKTVFYNTFDVTELLRRGRNALAVMLGNGMYHVENYPGRYTKFVGSFGQPKLILQLRVVFADGCESYVVSDAAWRTRPGPVTLSSPYNEDYDARQISTDWAVTDTGDGWENVLVVQGPGGRLRAQNIPPVMTARMFKPVSVSRPKPGVTVYDFGQNMSGWPVIAVRGASGTAVKLTTAELLADDGQVDPYSSGGRPGIEHYYGYTLGGRGVERWHPRFSSYGYRYVQVEGAAPAKLARKGEAVLLSIESAFLHGGYASTGKFATSDTLFARTHRLIRWALLNNSFSVLTDCPHREKLGWLEQTYLNADTVFCNEDAITLYEKMARDMAEAQTPDGMVPSIAPEYVAFLEKDGTSAIWRDSPEWGAAVVFSPVAAYRYYGDLRVLETGYSAGERYAAYLESQMRDGLIGFGMGDWYDIGPAPPGPAQLTSLTLTSTATYCGMVDALARIAALLGRDDDASRYRAKYEATKAVFNEKLFHPETGNYDAGSQTANAMPLALGLVPEDHRQAVLDNLVRDIRAHGNHVTAGDVGFHYVVLALMENRRQDVLYEMLSRTDDPSYGYQLARGATSLTEAWDANRRSSQDHFMLGHAETWFYRGLSGINVDMGKADPERIRIAPQTLPHVSGASARYRSVLGEIVSIWKRENARLVFVIAIPPGAQATIVLPARDAETVLEGGRPLARAPGVRSAVGAAGHTILTVGSGDYRFTVPQA